MACANEQHFVPCLESALCGTARFPLPSPSPSPSMAISPCSSPLSFASLSASSSFSALSSPSPFPSSSLSPPPLLSCDANETDTTHPTPNPSPLPRLCPSPLDALVPRPIALSPLDFSSTKHQRDAAASTSEDDNNNQHSRKRHRRDSDYEEARSAEDAVHVPDAGAAFRGDGQPCSLPTMDDGRPCRCITPTTMCDLLEGRLPQVRYVVIDCRFPFEYDGGHIKDAVNIWTEEQLDSFFFADSAAALKARAEGARTVYIFHCEFSSKRAPHLLQHLRNKDRQLHAHEYPALTFPDAYLLRGGYAEMFGKHEDLCEPRAYLPMVAPEFHSQLLSCQHTLRAKHRPSAVPSRSRSLLIRMKRASMAPLTPTTTPGTLGPLPFPSTGLWLPRTTTIGRLLAVSGDAAAAGACWPMTLALNA